MAYVIYLLVFMIGFGRRLALGTSCRVAMMRGWDMDTIFVS